MCALCVYVYVCALGCTDTESVMNGSMISEPTKFSDVIAAAKVSVHTHTAFHEQVLNQSITD